MDQGGQGAADVGMLSAGMAEVADQLGLAIEAMGFMRASVGPDFAGTRLDGAGDECAGDRVAQCIEFAAHAIPRCRTATLCGAAAAC